jgi:hypothetical protein
MTGCTYPTRPTLRERDIMVHEGFILNIHLASFTGLECSRRRLRLGLGLRLVRLLRIPEMCADVVGERAGLDV